MAELKAEFSYRWTLQAYRSAYAAGRSRRTIHWRIALFIFPLVFGIAGVLQLIDQVRNDIPFGWGFSGGGPLYLIAICILLGGGRPAWRYHTMRQDWKSQPEAGHTLTWTVDEKSLKAHCDIRPEIPVADFTWDDIRTVKEKPAGFLLKCGPRTYFWLPKCAFDKDAMETFRLLAKRHAGRFSVF